MQACQFSETQFSFCFTFEYIKQFRPFISLPVFPNTVVGFLYSLNGLFGLEGGTVFRSTLLRHTGKFKRCF